MPPYLTSVSNVNTKKNTKHHSRFTHDMGGAPSFKPFKVTFPFFPIIMITIILIGPSCIVAEADDDTRETPPPIPSHDNDNGGIATTSSTVSAEHSGHHGKKSEPFKPSTVVVVCVLTTMFSIIFILLLYVKHCNTGNTLSATNTTQQAPSEGRKNSGIDRAVVESLPIFRFRSLRGEKNGLDCAVCLTRFEDPEVLRLLPKCNHAFHVECVDTWLHAHSTCPLCRYKVDPEDIILVERQSQNQQQLPPHQQSNNENEQLETQRERKNNNNDSPRSEAQNPNRRVSGRHSSVGETDGGFLEIILQTPNENTETSSFRRSLDSIGASRNIKSEGVGCFVRPRKDGMLLTKDNDWCTSAAEHRLEHRIIVSPSNSSTKSHDGGGGGVHQQRWSDVEPSDLLYLTSEMIISDSYSSQQLPLLWNTRGGRRTVRNRNVDDEMENGGGGVMNLRSVSEITGMSRFVRNGNRNRNRGRRVGEEQRHEGVVSRWLAWISKTRPPGDVR